MSRSSSSSQTKPQSDDKGLKSQINHLNEQLLKEKALNKVLNVSQFLVKANPIYRPSYWRLKSSTGKNLRRELMLRRNCSIKSTRSSKEAQEVSLPMKVLLRVSRIC